MHHCLKATLSQALAVVAIYIVDGCITLGQAVMKAVQARGWAALHFSPCAALRSCGRLDEHWCRARNTTCDFPQVQT